MSFIVTISYIEKTVEISIIYLDIGKRLHLVRFLKKYEGRKSKMSNSFMDKLMSFVDVIAGPLTKFGNLGFVRGMVNGMVASSGVTMIGSVFLVLNLLGNPTGGLAFGGKALLPFLTPFADQLGLVNSLTMGLMAIYMVIGMGAEYAQIKGFNKTTGAVGAFLAFLFLNYNAVVDGALSVGNWGGTGIITAAIAMAISGNVIAFCYKHNIKITLPDSVPPAIADSFSAIIPYLFTVLICWGIRTIAGFDIPTVVCSMLLPVFSAADNVFIYTLSYFLVSLLWTCGLHGDNIVGAVTNTFVNGWSAENQNLFAAGTAVSELPYVWTGNLNRLHMWVSSCWPMLVYMYMSSKKLPHLKSLATISLPAAVFCIIEPIMFGLPVVLNAYLLIPFVVSHTITAALTYTLTQVGFVGKMCISLPWATPSPILGYLGAAGSVGGIIVVIINFAIGMVIFYPFWKAYEKAEVAKFSEEA